jgi:hypothetical protein
VSLSHRPLARGREFFADSGDGPDLFWGELTGPVESGPPPDAGGIRTRFRSGAALHPYHRRLYHPGSAPRKDFARAEAGGPADLLNIFSEMKMGMFTRKTLHAPDRPNRSWRDAAGKGRPKRPVRRPRFARSALGFWLGGAVLGTGGCVLGACMPCHHPVAVALSALWWGVYFGCFGASVGALIVLLTELPPAPPSRRVEGRS